MLISWSIQPRSHLSCLPLVLFKYCEYYIDPKGEGQVVKKFDSAAQAEFEELQQRWSAQGLRVLLLTFRRGTKDELGEGVELVDTVKNLCVVGLVGIMDPPREETAGVVATCQEAGVRVFMVTGDNAATAASIATRVGIFHDGNVRHTVSDIIGKTSGALDIDDHPQQHAHHDDHHLLKGFRLRRSHKVEHNPQDDPLTKASLLLTGIDLEKLNPHHWDVIERYKEIVFARTTPDQKFNIVKNLQQRYNVVAVTGDGVNDAPALKKANIGVAIGGGSDAAMESAAMVLLDANFSSIVVALRQGRTVFDNLKKVCLYLLPAGSFSELTPVLANIFFGVPLPLSSFLMM